MIRGKHLWLRTVERRDLETMRRWRNSPEIARFYEDMRPIGEAQQEQWFQRMSQDANSYYFIIEDASGPLGVCNLKNVNWIHRNADWGIYFAPREQGNAMLPVEASLLLLDWAFDCLNLHKVQAAVFPHNRRAKSLNKGLGFREEGVLKEHIFHEGRYTDLVLVAVFPDQYRKATAKFRAVLLDEDGPPEEE